MCNHYPRELGFDYMGVIVAIIGVIVAVVVGWQIYNLIHLDEIRRSTQNREKKFREFENKMNLLVDFLHAQSFQIRAHILWLDKKYIGCYIYNIFCLREYSRINKSGYSIHEQHFVDILKNCTYSLSMIIANNISKNKAQRVADIQELQNICQEIKETPINLDNKQYNSAFQSINRIADDYCKYINDTDNLSSSAVGDFKKLLEKIEESLEDITHSPQDYKLSH